MNLKVNKGRASQLAVAADLKSVRTNQCRGGSTPSSSASIEWAVRRARSYAETCRLLGRNDKGYALRKTVEEIKALGLDINHFNPMARKGPSPLKRPIETYLVENCSTIPSSTLRKRLIEEGLLRNECYECGQGPEWNGKPLTLQLDHMNGNAIDNRFENLRILCPNCHTQTSNYTSKNKGNGTRWKRND